MGSQLAARAHHTPDDQPHGRRQLVRIEPQGRELDLQTQLLRCRQRHVLGPDTARANDLQRCQVHPLVVGTRRDRLLLLLHRLSPAADDACRVLLGHRLPAGIQALDDEVKLSLHQRLDALGQRPPLRPRHLEVAPEIEHRALAYPLGRARRLDQAVGAIGLARLPALDRGAADKHGRTLAAERGRVNGHAAFYGTTPSWKSLSD